MPEFQKSQNQPSTPASPRNPRPKRQRRVRQPSAKYMTLQQSADHYQVDESTIRKGLSVFGRLRLVPTGRRTLVLRSSVERLDRELERSALRADGVAELEARAS